VRRDTPGIHMESIVPVKGSVVDLSKYAGILSRIQPVRSYGKVSEIVGLVVEGYGPGASIGEVCRLFPNGGARPVVAEIVGFRNGRILLMPLETTHGLGPGCKIRFVGRIATVPVGPGLLGRVVDGLGNPIDQKGPVSRESEYPVYSDPINPLARGRIMEPIDLGIRVVNGLFTCGRGQRLGIFAGSGVGKSVLLGMIARNTDADVNVIGLIGERGREVREFLEKNLGEEGLSRSVVVVAPSDTHPLIRMRAAHVATTVAEYYRDRGKHVLLMIDSLTRFAMAQREIGLSVGEPPATKGYTPSVFSVLPKLLERSGNLEGAGSITGIYTILVEGDDFNEPISDTARSILDGHIVLSRELANGNHYPAVDVLASISRIMPDIVDEEHRRMAGEIIRTVAAYQKARDLIHIGAYVKGSSPETDRAIAMIDRVNGFLKQDMNEKVTLQESRNRLKELLKKGA